MISFVSGIVDSIGTNEIVIDNNGIGISVFASQSAINECKGAGSRIRIYTYLHVREDEVSLYGFSREEERKLFLSGTRLSSQACRRFQRLLQSLECGFSNQMRPAGRR